MNPGPTFPPAPADEGWWGGEGRISPSPMSWWDRTSSAQRSNINMASGNSLDQGHLHALCCYYGPQIATQTLAEKRPRTQTWPLTSTLPRAADHRYKISHWGNTDHRGLLSMSNFKNELFTSANPLLLRTRLINDVLGSVFTSLFCASYRFLHPILSIIPTLQCNVLLSTRLLSQLLLL